MTYIDEARRARDMKLGLTRGVYIKKVCIDDKKQAFVVCLFMLVCFRCMVLYKYVFFCTKRKVLSLPIILHGFTPAGW